MNRRPSEFNFIFEGDIDSIDVDSLTGSLLNLNTLFQEINKELKIGDKTKLTIRTYQPGSFDVFLELVSASIISGVVSGLFSKEGIEGAKNIIDIAVSYLDLKKHLGGKPPKEVVDNGNGEIHITNNQGTVNVYPNAVFNLAQTAPKVDKAATKSFKSIQASDELTGARIMSNENKELFRAQKNTPEFEGLISPSPILQQDLENSMVEVVNDAHLVLSKIAFESNKGWAFYFQGNKIEATIEDSTFLTKVRNREYRFGNGDRITCRLSIKKEHKPELDVWVNREYFVVEVFGPPISPATQTTFDF